MWITFFLWIIDAASRFWHSPDMDANIQQQIQWPATYGIHLDMVGVVGSIPIAPTNKTK